MLCPALVKPKFISIRNRWRQGFDIRKQFGRDLVILIFSLAVVLGIYNGCSSALEKIHASSDVAYLPASLPMGLILLLLFSMLLFSNAVSALGAFYLGKDLDFILSAPVSKWHLYSGKLLEVLLSSSWMALIFGIPAIVAFGKAYDAPYYYYLAVIVVLLPYFVLPSAISVILVTLFTRIIPANKTRSILIIVGLLSLWGVYLLARLIDPDSTSFQDVTDVLRLVSILSIPNTDWVPSYWAAVCLGEILEPTGKSIWPYLSLLYSSAAFVVAGAFLLVRQLHYDAYSKSRSSSHALRLKSKTAHHRLATFTPLLNQQFRGIISKEYKNFSRDMTQAIQLLLLLGLCMIYLYNFRILHAIHGLPTSTRLWWQGFLVISNVGMGAFVITAVCTRFVFPSMSLEGQSFWILQTSPIGLRDILRAKFWCWLVPVATISSIIFASGALAINAEPHIVIINALSSWVICYGIVGLAVGLGAFFANFDWEHSSQLAASFGSLVFMLSSTILICASLVPVAILIFLRTMRTFGHFIPAERWYLAVGCCALLLAILNYYATDWALKVGENALEQRRS